MSDTIDEVVKGHRDAITVKRVFGEPLQQNGVTVVPAARVMGGGGGGAGESPEGQGTGTGSGFGIAAHPVGVYVIRGEEVSWQPAVDVNRIVTGALLLVGLALVLGRCRRR